jgi:hypothetical protein
MSKKNVCSQAPALPFTREHITNSGSMVLAFLNADWCACGVNVSLRRSVSSREQFVDGGRLLWAVAACSVGLLRLL